MRAGQLDRRISVQHPTIVEDALGSDIETWAELASVAAERVTQRATEAWKAGGTAAQREVLWRIRWSPKVAPLLDGGARYRIVYDGQVYPISGATEMGRRVGIEITTNPSGQTA